VLLESAEKAKEGDAIITNLRNTTFPIIRYQIGDIIDFGNGKSDLPEISVKTIDKIHGKYLDFIVLPDKTLISPHVPKQELTHLAGIKRFQILQDCFDRVTVKIEKDLNYTEETGKEILKRLSAAFKGQIACEIEYDDELSVKTRNKFKCISSNIAQSFLSEN
jgi:phenylacetate-coenzyme A ligase PaaK-like adenylate-forming protein